MLFHEGQGYPEIWRALTLVDIDQDDAKDLSLATAQIHRHDSTRLFSVSLVVAREGNVTVGAVWASLFYTSNRFLWLLTCPCLYLSLT
jgi:hypothetical protein